MDHEKRGWNKGLIITLAVVVILTIGTALLPRERDVRLLSRTANSPSDEKVFSAKLPTFTRSQNPRFIVVIKSDLSARTYPDFERAVVKLLLNSQDVEVRTHYIVANEEQKREAISRIAFVGQCIERSSLPERLPLAEPSDGQYKQWAPMIKSAKTLIWSNSSLVLVKDRKTQKAYGPLEYYDALRADPGSEKILEDVERLLELLRKG